MRVVNLQLPPPEPEADLGHCVRCGFAPLKDVRVEYYERGTLFADVPAWECEACGERYFHTGTMSRIGMWLLEQRR